MTLTLSLSYTEIKRQNIKTKTIQTFFSSWRVIICQQKCLDHFYYGHYGAGPTIMEFYKLFCSEIVIAFYLVMVEYFVMKQLESDLPVLQH